MPIYEYKCGDCGKTTEFLEGVGQGKIKKKCEYCGGTQLKKIFSAVNITISGGQDGKTCCGRDERCDASHCSGSICEM